MTPEMFIPALGLPGQTTVLWPGKPSSIIPEL